MEKSLTDLKAIFKNSNFQKIFKNFFYLFLLNISNFLLPLITFPFLVSRLGVEKFGLLAFVTSIISYFLILADYGFNLTATRQISLHREDKKKIDEIVSSIYTIKLLIVMASLIVLTLLIYFIPKFNEYYLIYYFTFGTVIGQSMFPVWYFQGIEKMGFISMLNIVSKIIFTVFVFAFISKPSDFYLVPIFNSMGYITIGIISIIVLLTTYKIKLRIVGLENIKYYMKDGWHLFVSNISVTLYTTAVTTILGFFTNNTIVGYYSIADKITQIIRGLVAPLSQALFPFLVKQGQESKDKILHINKTILKIGLLPFILLSLGIFIFAPEILNLILHEDSTESVKVLRILSVIPFLIFLATVFALFTMIVFNKNKEYSRIIISAGIFNLILAFIFIPIFKHIGAALCVLIVELYVTGRYIYYTQRNNMKLL